MNRKKDLATAFLSGTAMLVFILDTPTALSGAAEGINLCLATIIPSLFPFFVLSSLLTASLSSFRFRLLRPLGILCRLPEGSESLFVLGLLGGYPTGARNIAQKYEDGELSHKDAKRLMGFCSNAGPAFVFGVASSAFPEPKYAWILWGIHITAAVLTGILLSGRSQGRGNLSKGKPLTLPQALQTGLRNIAAVCGWIILFRILIGFLTNWFMGNLPVSAQSALCGLLELSIGCCTLNRIENLGLKFVICAAVLGFGGLCVLMQTVSVSGKLGLGAYIPGKLLHGALSFQLAYQVQHFLLNEDQRLTLPFWSIILLWLCLFAVKITVAIGRIMVYNSDKSRIKRSRLCCFAKILQRPVTTASMAPATKRV